MRHLEADVHRIGARSRAQRAILAMWLTLDARANRSASSADRLRTVTGMTTALHPSWRSPWWMAFAWPRAASLVLGSMATVSLVAGCALAPSDPEVPPVGVRQDAGILSVIVPLCSGDSVRSASIVKLLADREPDAAWSATDFKGDRSHGIVLGPRDWSGIRGSYQSLTAFSIDVTTDRHTYGTLVESPFLERTKSLPSGAFLVNDHVMTMAEYTASVSRFPC
jgi:hypothetical protein